jgi:hypothetical protein
LWDPNAGKVLLLTTSGPPLWDLDTGKAIHTFKEPIDGVKPVALAFYFWHPISEACR